MVNRHRSWWASDTSVATFGAVIVFVTWLIWELVGDAPTALNSLLGIAAGAWFGAFSSDARKRERDEVERRVEEREGNSSTAEEGGR